ncbi:MAG TPA: 4-alpha-glucanotransferase [Pirellulales bacterium]|nr:4-alpha-glucanotransferase [Pirellulales bacterium]
MSDSRPAANTPLQEPGYRASGMLLHVTSLPSPYGIGDVGPCAFAWIDRLHDAGQSWWQGLPLGPTGYANSPYQSLSSFAGNWLLISPDGLVADGLVKPADVAGLSFADDAVDYDAVSAFKLRLLRAASANLAAAGPELKLAFEVFCQKQAHWLDDYALFRALKVKYGGVHYLDWPQQLVRRDESALAEARRELANLVGLARLAQFLLYRQGERLKQYARAKGIRLIGDLPFFVSPDSSDVWANPELFLLDEQRRPHFVAGVPPDYFSPLGQLWGNPVYDWEALRRTGYRWCIDRVRALLAHVDLIRLDHFRGFAAAWHIPVGAPTAQTGQWVPGPGAEFFRAVEKDVGRMPFIAEDLGMITPDVTALRDEFRLPGMRILQFAFDGSPKNPYLPENYSTNSIVYTGTHDNNTTRGWFDELPDDQRQNMWRYLKRSAGDGGDAAKELVRLAWASPAVLALAPLQDLLGLGAEARMNVPGRVDGNWRWRATDEMLSSSAFQWLGDLTKTCNRSPARQPKVTA